MRPRRFIVRRVYADRDHVQPGSDTAPDVLMQGSAIAQPTVRLGSLYETPAVLPQGGGWGAWLSGYGVADWLQFNVQSNRTVSVSYCRWTKLAHPTERKARRWIGIWPLSDESGGPAPSSTPSAFNYSCFRNDSARGGSSRPPERFVWAVARCARRRSS